MYVEYADRRNNEREAAMAGSKYMVSNFLWEWWIAGIGVVATLDPVCGGNEIWERLINNMSVSEEYVLERYHVINIFYMKFSFSINTIYLEMIAMNLFLSLFS